MVQCLASTFGRDDSYIQIVFDLALPNKIIKTARAQAGIKWRILTAGFTRRNASYFNLAPLDSY